MSDLPTKPHESSALDQTPNCTTEDQSACSQDRRRLLRTSLVVTPIILTLVSRPVLAWHCRSPSAWGSMQINPNTSLATNNGHKLYADETWSISQWINNTTNSATGISTAPQTYLCQKLNTKTKFSKLTIANLSGLGIVCPYDLTNTTLLLTALKSSNHFDSYTLAAQLNYALLAQRNGWTECISQQELQDMALGSYKTLGNNFAGCGSYKNFVTTYLYNNWMVQ